MTKIVKAAGAALALVMYAGVASAQWLNPGVSCIDGDVPANDYAELTSNYKESLWDSKAGMRALSDGGQLDLNVTDNYGTEVCDKSIDDRARCKFSFSPSYSGSFNIRVTNSQSNSTKYRLCAE